MTGPAILAELRDLGATVRLQGPDLRVTAALGEKLPPDLVERLKGEKSAIVAELLKEFDEQGMRADQQSGDAPTLLLQREAAAAAVREPPPADFKALLRQISEGVDRLEQMPPPGDYCDHLHQWAQAVGGARRFLDVGWAGNALTLNWQVIDLFAAHRRAPFEGAEHRGLALRVGDGAVIEMDQQRAMVRAPQGGVTPFIRRPIANSDVVLAWELGEGPA